MWKRTIASQMTDARSPPPPLRLAATTSDGVATLFTASGTVVTFPGFLAAYEESRDDDAAAEQRRLPHLAQGDAITIRALTAEDHSTKTSGPLHRGLVAQGARGARDRPALDLVGDHRHVVDRGYVFKRGSALVPPGWRSRWCVCWRTISVRWSTTASPPDSRRSDVVASGDESRSVVLGTFYFGGDDPAGGRSADCIR